MSLFKITGKNADLPKAQEKETGNENLNLNTPARKRLSEIVNEQKECWSTERLAELEQEPETVTLREYLEINNLELVLAPWTTEHKIKGGIVLRPEGFKSLGEKGRYVKSYHITTPGWTTYDLSIADVSFSKLRDLQTDVPSIKQKIAEVIKDICEGKSASSITGLRKLSHY